MAEVKIRRLPDWVVDHHKRNAERAGRSLEEELRILLTQDASAKRDYWLTRAAKTREGIRKRHGTMADLTKILREERERLG
jgi:plasmid stability protein